MKVCHIIGSLRIGGAERQFVNIVNNLPCEEVHAVFLTSDKDDGFYSELKPEVKKLFVPTRLRYAFVSIWRISQYLKNNNIDIVQTHMNWANAYGAIAALLAGTPIVVSTFHGENEYSNLGFFGSIYHLMQKYIVFRHVDAGFAVSEQILENLIARGYLSRARALLIGNAVDVPPESELSRPGSNQRVLIGAVGRLVPEKDFDCFLTAVSLLSEYEFDVVIIGDGPLRSSLLEKAKSLGLSDRVRFLGARNDVNRWMSQLDIFVMSSISEGEPMALLEAMSYGVPVVATRVGNIPTLVRQEREGLLVESNDPGALAGGIKSLIDDQSFRVSCGMMARKKIQEERSIDALVGKYLDIYRSLLADKVNS